MNKLVSALVLSVGLMLSAAASASAMELATVTVVDQKSGQTLFMSKVNHASLTNGVVLSQVETLSVLSSIVGNKKMYSKTEVGSKMKLQLNNLGH
ncbi:MAG: hypothetical protein GXO35_06370, partial [Gammaproteobacteria bacterium]|nr:hypothetical protein [Gammaproteobacteria bacterium]